MRAAGARWRYKGIDRLLRLPLDESDAVEIVSGLRSEYLKALDSLAEVEDSLLRIDLPTAQQFRRIFLRLGFPSDILYVRIVGVPARLEEYRRAYQWPASVREGLARRVANHHHLTRSGAPLLEFHGFDVSLPVPSFHSALVNPGLPNFEGTFARKLNDAGLFGSFAHAEQCMEASNQMGYSDLPFCVLAIHGAGGDTDSVTCCR
jgi:hypothetical protein